MHLIWRRNSGPLLEDFITIRMLSFAVDLHKVLNASVPGFLLFFSEVTGRKFSVSTVIGDALAALFLSWAARIGAVAFLKIFVDFTLQDQYLPLFISFLILSESPPQPILHSRLPRRFFTINLSLIKNTLIC